MWGVFCFFVIFVCGGERRGQRFQHKQDLILGVKCDPRSHQHKSPQNHTDTTFLVLAIDILIFFFFPDTEIFNVCLAHLQF